jgi:hypothetical protein
MVAGWVGGQVPEVGDRLFDDPVALSAQHAQTSRTGTQIAEHAVELDGLPVIEQQPSARILADDVVQFLLVGSGHGVPAAVLRVDERHGALVVVDEPVAEGLLQYEQAASLTRVKIS